MLMTVLASPNSEPEKAVANLPNVVQHLRHGSTARRTESYAASVPAPHACQYRTSHSIISRDTSYNTSYNTMSLVSTAHGITSYALSVPAPSLRQYCTSHSTIHCSSTAQVLTHSVPHMAFPDTFVLGVQDKLRLEARPSPLLHRDHRGFPQLLLPPPETSALPP